MVWSRSVVYPSVAVAQQTMPNARPISSYFLALSVTVLTFPTPLNGVCVCVCVCVHTPRGGILVRIKTRAKECNYRIHQQQQIKDTHTPKGFVIESPSPVSLCCYPAKTVRVAKRGFCLWRKGKKKTTRRSC